MCRNIIIGLLILIILLGAGCGLLAFRYREIAGRANEQAQRIGGLAEDVNGYRKRITEISGELADEHVRAGEIAERLGNVTAENIRLADTLVTIRAGIAEGRGGVERITESEERTADIYMELENYLDSFLDGAGGGSVD